MPTVVVPVPPGFAVVPRSVRAPDAQKTEDLGAELHLYLTRLDPGASSTATWRLRATHEAEVSQRPARAYAYYDPAVSGASGSLKLRSTRR